MEKKIGPCVLPIKIFPQLYTIHALKQHKILVAHDKLTKGGSVIYKNLCTLSIYVETDETYAAESYLKFRKRKNLS